MKIIPLVAVSLAVTLACSFVTTSPLLAQKEPLYAIAGSLNPTREITVPAKSRVLVLWMVSGTDPDSAYIFGEGTVDFENYSFVIEFDEPPPPEALNHTDDVSFGMGFVILTANQKWDTGTSFDELPEDILGISANHLVIYMDGNFDALPNADWFAGFNQGYNVGQVVDVPDPAVFDKVVPAAPNSIQIIIDDLENIKFLNFS